MKYSPSRLGHPGQGRSLNRLHLPRFADACMGRRDPFQFVTSVTRPTRADASPSVARRPY
jgi:hypothetical protein